MRIHTHGGKCCGIRVIHDLGTDPEDKHEASPKTTSFDHIDIRGAGGAREYHHPGTNFYPLAAPEESYIERLDRYIRYLDDIRPKGVIEIVLVSTAHVIWKRQLDQVGSWEPHLLERGFRLVNRCLNSNSSNYINIYHRNSGEVPVLKENESESNSPQPDALSAEVAGVSSAV
jgi:hypothetical protein